MKKKFLAMLAAGMIALGSFGAVDAATRDEIAAIQVKKAKDFKYWTKDSVAKQKLVEYVTDVTNKRSKNFIPVADRIAVFDVDGTVACETAPFCFDFMMFVHRALDDPDYIASARDRENGELVKAAIYNRKMTNDVRRKHCESNASVFAGMTADEFAAYTKNFLDTPVEGFDNLKVGEAFYLPMVEVISYLRANDFKIFLVSGADRDYMRTSCEILGVDSDNMIGTDYKHVATNQGDTDGMDYTLKPDDKVVRGGFLSKDINMNKVSNMAREIGKQPVLAFGNSTGDSSMINFSLRGNKYRTAAFFVICDDLNREFGNVDKANKCIALADKNGWIKISMRDDFKTIYGDNVKLSK
ncbi:MAG: haloacid dehalogenase-like hydrolase [Selenomonadaceae bacterium]|nr:haloacid dehalogenase-like hydrolase [Selenomonadaceae bacterium]MBQ9498476.1 haloacid dehalogenase-like hydrolase [Selenomonadaceae bacterium]